MNWKIRKLGREMFSRFRLWMRELTQWLQFRELSTKLGPRSAFVFLLHRQLVRLAGSFFSLHPSHVNYPLWVRSGSSDLNVFSQIFIEAEYECLGDITNVDFDSRLRCKLSATLPLISYHVFQIAML